jgi:formylglycine-generating enzyme required for sulfatase activity/tetratricopeptide (TPR) repeat protein
MTDKPDFIVDPSGNAWDVRGRKCSQESQFSSSQQPEPGALTPDKDGHTGSTQRTPGGIIFIPIGLIITLIIAVIRMLGGPAQKNSYAESDVNTLNLGLSYYDQGDYEKAIIHFNMAIASQPDMGEAYNDRGLTYYAMGETDKAITDFNKAIELLPNPAVSYSNRGGLYLFQGNHEQALADLDKAIELSPRLAKAYHNRGLTYLDLGKYDQAIADFDQAIELTPEFPFSAQATMESRKPTGESLFGSGFLTGLMDRQTYADLPTAYASRAMADLQKGDYGRAAWDLKKATQLGLDPGFAQQVEALLAVSTLEPQPVSTLVPQTGHWLGSSNQGGYQGPVSFDIAADEQIHNFKLGLVFGSDNSCVVESQDVWLEADGTFSFTFDPYGMGNGILTQGKFVSSTLVSGSFSGTITCIPPKATHLNGGQSQGDSWSAQWISGPEQTPVSSENQASAFPSDFLDAYGVVMINVPAGTFTMGNDDANSYDRPVHSVYLDAYVIDKYEVTNKLYKDCVDAGVCIPLVWLSSDTRSDYYGNLEFDEYPVVNVDWNMAKTYCEWRGARLPTEAEWEKAARGTDGRIYPWGNDAPNKNLLNFNQEVGNSTKTGSYEAGRSFYGAYDMAGNVMEWVNDWYGETYYRNSPLSNPLGPDSGQYRVLRGGSWAHLGSDVRSAYRERYNPSSPNYLVGFRCACSLP